MDGAGRRSRLGCAFLEILETRRLFAYMYTVTPEDISTFSLTSFGQDGVARANNAGLLVGTHNVPVQGVQQFRAYYATTKSSVDLSPLAAGPGSIAEDISDGGAIVGYTTGGSHDEATEWGKKTYDLGAGQAEAISLDGSFVVGETPKSQTHHAALFGGKTPIDLGDLGGGTSEALGVNTSGVIVGDSLNASNTTVPFYYTSKKKMTRIGDGTSVNGAGAAYAINDEGLVVGEMGKKAFSFDTTKNTLTFYSAATMTGSITNFGAIDVNNVGDMVGFTQTTTTQHATLWENGMAIDLNTLIPSDSGITLEVAKSINDLGQIVALGQDGPDTISVLLSPNSFSLSSKGTLTILGSIGPDVVGVAVKGSKINVGVNGAGGSFKRTKVKRIAISLAGGNDVLSLGVGLPSATIDAGAGKDTLYIRDGARDIVDGGAGIDQAQVDKADVLTSVEAILK